MKKLHYYLTLLTHRGRTVEHGWMLAADDNELVAYARTMGYGIAITHLGEADISSVTPALVPGTESEAPKMILRGV